MRFLKLVAFIGVLIISLNNTWAEDGVGEIVPQIEFSMFENGFKISIDNVAITEVVDCTWNDVSILDVLVEQIQNGSVIYNANGDSIVLDIRLNESHNGIFDDMPIFSLVLSSGEIIAVPVAFYEYETSRLRYWSIVWRGVTYVWKFGRWVVAKIATKSLSSIIKGSRYLKTSRSAGKVTTHYSRRGGFRQANKDFDALGLSNIRNYGNGTRVGYKNGKTFIVRSRSSEGRPTIEVQYGKTTTKIRYD